MTQTPGPDVTLTRSDAGLAIDEAGTALRVLVVHAGTDRYGSDKQVAESVRALRGAGAEVTLCVPGPGALLDALPDVPVVFERFSVLRKALAGPVGIAGLAARAPGEIVRLSRTIRRIAPDVVYVNTVTIPTWLAAARLARVPAVAHVHEAEADAARSVRVALAAPLALATAVIANSATSRAVLVEARPSLRDRVRVVLNGLPDRGPATAATDPRDRIVMVGRLSPRKGADVLLDAVGLLRRDSRPVRVEICGSVFTGYEWYERELRDRAAQADLQGAVTFHGYVEDPHEVLDGAAAVVVPSRVEPFGNAAVEAMLARRPVIASDVQGLAEIVSDGVTGLLVAPDDPAALAAALADVLDNPERAELLAERARTDALARFSPQRYADEVVSAVRSARPARSQAARR